MLISKKSIIGPILPVTMGDFYVNWVKRSRLLGVTVDESLTWSPHLMNFKRVSQISLTY